jgi:hypothetical protein
VVFDRNKYVFFFAALAVLSLCLFVNVPEFLYRVLYVIPVFRFVRLVEVKVVYAFCLSVLAGWGFSSVVGEPKLATRGWMRVMSLALMVVGLVALAASGILGLMGAGIGSVDLPSFPGVNDLQGLLRLGLVLTSGAVILLLRVQGRLSHRRCCGCRDVSFRVETQPSATGRRPLIRDGGHPFPRKRPRPV